MTHELELAGIPMNKVGGTGWAFAKYLGGCGSTPMGSHFGVGAPPILEPILVGIHWGYDLDFDPWAIYLCFVYCGFPCSALTKRHTHLSFKLRLLITCL